jgi:hypothetical protein
MPQIIHRGSVAPAPANRNALISLAFTALIKFGTLLANQNVVMEARSLSAISTPFVAVGPARPVYALSATLAGRKTALVDQ